MGSSISFAKLDMDTDGKLTGREKFPIVGNRISLSVAEQIQKEFAGLFSHWDCLDKAKIVTKHIRDSQIVVGSLNLASSDMTSLYGHEFHPPYEFHAWGYGWAFYYRHGPAGSNSKRSDYLRFNRSLPCR